VSKW